MLVTNRFNMIGMDGGIKLKQWPPVIPSLWDIRSLISTWWTQIGFKQWLPSCSSSYRAFAVARAATTCSWQGLECRVTLMGIAMVKQIPTLRSSAHNYGEMYGMVWCGMVWYAMLCNARTHTCMHACVCVEHLKRCKTSTLFDGIAFSFQVLCHYNEPVLSILPGVYPISFSIAGGVTVDFLATPTKLWKSTGWKFGRKLLYLQCRSWAHSSRSWGTRHI